MKQAIARTYQRPCAVRGLSMVFCATLLAIAGCVSPGGAPFVGRPAKIADEQSLPPVSREFRGLWVATVGNIDWPSKPGLPVEQQKGELIAILDRAAECRLNAIVLQVRPACDALYRSSLEPWSEYLTGEQGRGPEPAYDPLEFAINAAHARGLELHAWLNPFRVRPKDVVSPVAANHISRTRPDLVRQYGNQLWLDPGDPAAQEHSLRVVRDVAQRYDIDAIHMDDYFYPYAIREAGQRVDFPDEPTWAKYQASGGALSRDDWRRDNINRFVERLYRDVKAIRPSIRVGISPFGIWRPGNPPTIKGMDAYKEIYADSRLWLMNGWVDYFAPQLYWPIASEGQSFPVLLDWWREQNPQRRLIWPGLIPSRIGSGSWRAEEIVNQIRETRSRGPNAGAILFSAKPIMQDRGGIVSALKTGVYTEAALPPAADWLGAAPPGPPEARLSEVDDGRALRLVMRPRSGGATPRFWLIRLRIGESWQTMTIAGSARSFNIEKQPGQTIELIALNAIDDVGNLSAPVVVR